MRSSSCSPDPRRRRAWSDVTRSVLAGAAAGVGVIGAHQALTTLGLLALFMLVAGITASCRFCVRPEDAPWTTSAAWWTVTVPLTVIATFGLIHALGLYGLVLATVVAASSPPVTSRASRLLFRMVEKNHGAAYSHAEPPPYARRERDRVNRRFEELVSGLDDSGEAQES